MSPNCEQDAATEQRPSKKPKTGSMRNTNVESKLITTTSSISHRANTVQHHKSKKRLEESGVSRSKCVEGNETKAAASLTTSFLPQWGRGQMEKLRDVAGKLFIAQRLCFKVLPLVSTGTDLSKIEALPSAWRRDHQPADPETAALLEDLRKKQLLNLKEYLPSRVGENLSFWESPVNNPAAKRNSLLPPLLLPSLQPTRKQHPGPISYAKAAADEAAAKLKLHVSVTESDADSSSSTAVEVHGPVESVAKIYHTPSSSSKPKRSKLDFSFNQRRKLKSVQKAVSGEAFTGFWALLLTERYHVLDSKETGSLCGDAGATKRLIVCGALVEVFENEERQLQALWCCPSLSSSSTRLLIDVFIRAVAVEAILFDMQSLDDRERDGGKEGDSWKRGDGGVPPEQQRRRLVFASCEDLLVWPRQAAFLMVAPELQGWKLHREWEPDDSGDDNANGGAAAYQHVDPGFGPDCNRCPCLDMNGAQEENQHNFYAISEAMMMSLLPAKAEREQLQQQLTQEEQTFLPPGWKGHRGWIDTMEDIRIAALATEAAAEVYASLPLLPLLLDEPPLNIRDTELCGLDERRAIAIHSQLQNLS